MKGATVTIIVRTERERQIRAVKLGMLAVVEVVAFGLALWHGAV